MATIKVDPNESALWKAIRQIHVEMETVTADSPEFAKMTEQLVVLYKALPTKEPRVKLDSVLSIAGNLLGIGMILGFEKTGVITTKALGFVKKA